MFIGFEKEEEEKERSDGTRGSSHRESSESQMEPGVVPFRGPEWSTWFNLSECPQLLLATVMGVALVCVSAALLRWVWWTPRRLERLLRQQGIGGTQYRLLVGDLTDYVRLQKEALSMPMPAFSHDIGPRVYPLIHQFAAKPGRISYIWLGPYPRVIVNDPDMIKDVLSNKFGQFGKPIVNPCERFVMSGLFVHEGEKWAKHRRIIAPAFHVEKLKCMLPAFSTCCAELIGRWEMLAAGQNGSCELDVWPEFQNFSGDVISRTAFGSSLDEGRRIFQLQAEQSELLVQSFRKIFIPGYRFLPTTINRKMKETNREMRGLLRNIIMKREKAMELGISHRDDLLGVLLESNQEYFKENRGDGKEQGKMTIDDVIDECKLFYLAGQETTADLLTWVMVVLSMHPSWQARAREEVLNVLGKRKPDFDSLSQLKVVTMVVYEVLRLYPPAALLIRRTNKELEMGGFKFPAGVHLFLPILSIHRNPIFWGEDAKDFNPERFAGGIAMASKHQMAFFPFSSGPRICIGKNYALLEAKMVIAMMLQHFSFELSPSYQHEPSLAITLHPKHGAPLILRKIC